MFRGNRSAQETPVCETTPLILSAEGKKDDQTGLGCVCVKCQKCKACSRIAQKALMGEVFVNGCESSHAV